MPGILKYRDPATGDYLPVPGTAGGGSEEVWVGPDSPFQAEDLWVDTAQSGAVYDWSTADARYLTSGFRNVIRNGDMQIAQRGNSFSGFGPTLDGWLTGGSGGTVTTTRTTTSTTLPPYVSVAVAGQSAVGDYCRYVSRAEDVRTLNGSVVTVSFTAWAASGSPKVAVEFGQLFGTGGSVTAPIAIPCGTVTLSTTVSRYTLTFAVPSTTGKSLGTNNDHYVDISFWFSAGSNYSSRVPGLGIQSGTFYITDVQLEAGSAASAFERLPVQQQLAWCQRYFNRIGANNPNIPWNTTAPFGTGFASGQQCIPYIPFPVPMRAVPSVVFSAANTFYPSATTGWPATAMAVDQIASRGFTASASVASGLTSNQAVGLYTNTTSAAYIDISAEL